MNVDALKTNLTELGTKIQTGAVGLAKEGKVKAEALTAKAGEAIANHKQKREAAAAAKASAEQSDAEGGDASDAPQPPKRASVRDTIAGVASKLKPPGVRIEEGSIADILRKARAKVFRADASGATSTEATLDDNNGIPNTDDFESMKESVDGLASEMESTANDKESPKERVQKNLILMFSKLKIAQDKFVAMVEERKKKKAASAAAEDASDAPAVGEDAATDDNADAKAPTPAGGERVQQLKNLLSTAENAARKAFENAEKVAREAAKKTGLLNKNDDTKTAETTAEETASEPTSDYPKPEPNTETNDVAASEPEAPTEEEETSKNDASTEPEAVEETAESEAAIDTEPSAADEPEVTI